MIFSFFILTFFALFPMHNSAPSELSLRNLAADYLLKHENLLKDKLLDEQTNTFLKHLAVKKLIEKQDILSKNSTFWVDCELQVLDKIPWNSEIKYEKYYIEEKVEDVLQMQLGKNYSQRFDVCYVVETISNQQTVVVYRDKGKEEFYYYFFTQDNKENAKVFHSGKGSIVCQTIQHNTIKSLYATIIEIVGSQVITHIYNLTKSNGGEHVIKREGYWVLDSFNSEKNFLKLKKQKDGTEIVLAKFDPEELQLHDVIIAANAQAPRETLIDLLLSKVNKS